MSRQRVFNITESDKTAIIDIEGDIGYDWWSETPDANTKEKVKHQLRQIAELKAETIIVNINSYGGDVNHGLSIHDLLAEHPAKVITKINGMTASAATIIAMAGSKGNRMMSANSLVLVHRAWTGAFGNKNNIETVLDDLKKIDQRIIDIYSKRSGTSTNEIEDLMDRANGDGVWIDAEEALSYGLIDEIYEPMEAAAFVPTRELVSAGLPLIPQAKKQHAMNLIDKINGIFSNRQSGAQANFDITTDTGDTLTIITDEEGRTEPAVGDEVQDANGEPVADGDHALGGDLEGTTITTTDGSITAIDDGSEEETGGPAEEMSEQARKALNKVVTSAVQAAVKPILAQMAAQKKEIDEAILAVARNVKSADPKLPSNHRVKTGGEAAGATDAKIPSGHRSKQEDED